MENKPPTTIDEYIAQYPPEIQQKLTQLRALIHAAAPGVKEKISYGMPGFSLDGKNLVWFGVYKHHLSFFPRATSGTDPDLEKDLAAFKGTKGSVHLPFDQPIPDELISRLVRF